MGLLVISFIFVLPRTLAGTIQCWFLFVEVTVDFCVLLLLGQRNLLRKCGEDSQITLLISLHPLPLKVSNRINVFYKLSLRQLLDYFNKHRCDKAKLVTFSTAITYVLRFCTKLFCLLVNYSIQRPPRISAHPKSEKS